MQEINSDSVQNRFTAYLIVAVTNKRMRYMENRKKLQVWEFVQMDLLEKNYLDFEMQYHDYIREQTSFVLQDYERFREWLILLENERLVKAIGKLKIREKRLLFARVFGELTFEELGKRFGCTSRQAEMAFYYILRKLRKELEVSKKDEF